MRAIKISSRLTNRIPNMGKGDTKIFLNMKINPKIVKITRWPATMFAKSRIARAKCLVSIPRISTMKIIGATNQGKSGGKNPFK